MQKQIERMQEHLYTLRAALKMSCEEFGELIGVTRQTINNLETKKHKMTKTQFLAICYVIDKMGLNPFDDADILAFELYNDIIMEYEGIVKCCDKNKQLEKINIIQTLAPALLRSKVSRQEIGALYTKIITKGA